MIVSNRTIVAVAKAATLKKTTNGVMRHAIEVILTYLASQPDSLEVMRMREELTLMWNAINKGAR